MYFKLYHLDPVSDSDKTDSCNFSVLYHIDLMVHMFVHVWLQGGRRHFLDNHGPRNEIQELMVSLATLAALHLVP